VSYYGRSEFKWWHFLPLRDKIDDRTAPINTDYLLVFGSSESKLSREPVDTGYCDFKSRRCWVNCESANVAADPHRPWQKEYTATEQEQYIMTMRIAAHERAHARWTDFNLADFELKPGEGEKIHPSRKGTDANKQYDRLLHMVFNILEDERIERLIERDFRHLRGYLRMGSKMRLRQHPIEDFHWMGEVKGQKIPNDPNDPSLIIAWILRRRHLERTGLKEAPPLGDLNLQKLAKIDPLIRKSAIAKSSHEVVDIAKQIIDIIEIREYNEMLQRLAKELSRMQGSRGPGDKAKGRSRKKSDESGTVSRGDNQEGEGEEGEDGEEGEGKSKKNNKGKDDGEGNGPIKREGKKQQNRKGDGAEHGPGTDRDRQNPKKGEGGKGQGSDEQDESEEGDDEGNGPGGWNDDAKQAEKGASEDVDRDFLNSGYQNAQGSLKKRRRVHAPGPYEELLASIRPYLNAMNALFRSERTKPGVDHDRNGSRLDVKRAMRKNVEPFKIPAPPSKSGKMSISIVIDESGSMQGKKEWEAKRVAMMFYEALRVNHKVRVAVAPTGEIIAASEDGEMGKAYVAGYDSSSGTCFNEVLTRELEELAKDKNSKVRYAILIADGESGSDDGRACKKSVDAFKRRGIRCLGVGLCLSDGGDKFFSDIFGDYYLSIDDAGHLLSHMSRVLRTLATRAKEGGRKLS
jgi:hypothetical protein